MQIGNIEANPFAILSFIIAPAILTNASSVLAMSTSNRLGQWPAVQIVHRPSVWFTLRSICSS